MTRTAFPEAPAAGDPQDLWIAGHVFGDIDAEAVTVMHEAMVDGSLDAKSVVIHGRVSGTVRAPAITLGHTAVVEGELYYETLSIAPGARVEARCVPN